MSNSTCTDFDMQDMLHRLERCEHRQRAIGGTLLATVAAGAFFATRTPAISQTSSQLQAEITALQNTLKYVSTTGTDMYITGANLHIVNGRGTTSTENGLGNLVIGYNELRNDTPSTHVRNGSHNLIMGTQNSYSSYSGIIGGRHNTSSGNYACVEGGLNNTASGEYAVIGGGYLNTASGTYSNVVGGQNNTASGSSTLVMGGSGGTAAANNSAVIGGESNTTNGAYSIVLGGQSNTTTAAYQIIPLSTYSTEIAAIDTSISGINVSIGSLQTSNASYKTEIANLQSNTKYITTGKDEDGYPATFITGCNVWIRDGSGSTNDGVTLPNTGPFTGLGNLIIGYNETSAGHNPNGDIRAGSHNLIVGTGNSYSSYGGVVFGLDNSSLGFAASVTGGQRNSASGIIASVTGGFGNTAAGEGASVNGGLQNTAGAYCASVTGGSDNTASFQFASVTGGRANTASGETASVTGGWQNSAEGFGSSIVGGVGNIVTNDPTSPAPEYSYGAILGGLNITVSTEYGIYPQ